MAINNVSKEDLISALRGLNIKDFSIRELEYLEDLFKVKSRQIDEEIGRRRREGKEN